LVRAGSVSKDASNLNVSKQELHRKERGPRNERKIVGNRKLGLRRVSVKLAS